MVKISMGFLVVGIGWCKGHRECNLNGRNIPPVQFLNCCPFKRDSVKTLLNTWGLLFTLGEVFQAG